MEETVSQGILPPVLSDVLLFLSLAINIMLMFAVAYLVARNPSGEIKNLDNKIKKLSQDLKTLEGKVQELKPHKKVDTVPPAEPFGINPNLPREVPNDMSKVWKKFVESYNFIAASMSVPGQLKACKKFVEENGLRMLQYTGMMNFIPALEVEESNYWLWKMSPDNNLYAVVPNPMKPCDSELYERGGLKMVFAMNFQDGVYKKYVVDTPAIFTIDGSNHWKLQDPGVIDLARK